MSLLLLLLCSTLLFSINAFFPLHFASYIIRPRSGTRHWRFLSLFVVNVYILFAIISDFVFGCSRVVHARYLRRPKSRNPRRQYNIMIEQQPIDVSGATWSSSTVPPPPTPPMQPPPLSIRQYAPLQ